MQAQNIGLDQIRARGWLGRLVYANLYLLV